MTHVLFSSSLIQSAEKHLRTRIEQAQPLTQGNTSETFIVTTASQQKYIIKRSTLPVSEGKMLQFMARNHIKVPKVIFVDKDILILEFIQETNSFSLENWNNLGSMLMKMHGIQNEHYGWSDGYAFGKVRMVNTLSTSWIEFWGQYRLGYYLGHLPVSTAGKLEKLINRLDQLLPEKPKPSLLHGDLWTGNIIAHNNQSYLIDPACYFGHNEVDIAMLNLFGSPHEVFYETYTLLEKDWQQRMPIYQLFPLIIHYLLFGNYYLRMMEQILSKMHL